MRGEAALKARLPKEAAKKNAAISPYDKGMAEAHMVAAFHSEAEEHNPPCIGDLLQYTRKGKFLYILAPPILELRLQNLKIYKRLEARVRKCFSLQYLIAFGWKFYQEYCVGSTYPSTLTRNLRYIYIYIYK